MRRFFPGVLFLVGLLACSQAEVRGGVPEKAVEYSRATGHSGLMVWVGGRKIFEEYRHGVLPQTRFPAFSITKSIVAMGFFVAQQRELLSLDQPVGAILPGAPQRSVRISDLLSFSAGLPSGRQEFYGARPKDPRAHARKFSHKTGMQKGMFLYGPGSFEVAGEVLTTVLEKRAEQPLSFLQKTVLQPAGASVQGWKTRRDGTPLFSTGALLSLGEMAALGELLRKDGAVGLRRIWNKGTLQLLLQGSSEVPMYFLGFWRNRLARESGAREVPVISWLGTVKDADLWSSACISTSAPEDLLAMMGSGGQRIYVIPSKKLVIARIGGRGDSFEDAEFFRNWF